MTKIALILFTLSLVGCGGHHIHNLDTDCEMENPPYARCKDV